MLTALAITATSFAAMVIPASAADITYVNENFDNVTIVDEEVKGADGKLTGKTGTIGESLTYSQGHRSNA